MGKVRRFVQSDGGVCRSQLNDLPALPLCSMAASHDESCRPGGMSRVTMNVLFLHSGGEWLRGSENALLVALRGVRRRASCPCCGSSNPELLAAVHREGIETIQGSMPEIMIDGEHVRLSFSPGSPRFGTFEVDRAPEYSTTVLQWRQHLPGWILCGQNWPGFH